MTFFSALGFDDGPESPLIKALDSLEEILEKIPLKM